MKILIVTGKNSSIWREIYSFFDNYMVFFLDLRSLKISNINNINLNFDCLNKFDNFFILHFGAATPNNSKTESIEYFLEINYHNIIKLLNYLIVLKKNITLLNISTTSIYNKQNKNHTLMVDSEYTTKSDFYGYSKLLFLNFLNECKYEKIMSITVIVPVLIGKYTTGNFITKMIDNHIYNRDIQLAYIHNDFNALVSVRVLKKIAQYFFGIDYFIKGNLTILACGNKPVKLINIINLLDINKYEIVSYDNPPKLIDITSMLNFMPSFSCCIQREILFYYDQRKKIIK